MPPTNRYSVIRRWCLTRPIAWHTCRSFPMSPIARASVDAPPARLHASSVANVEPLRQSLHELREPLRFVWKLLHDRRMAPAPTVQPFAPVAQPMPAPAAAQPMPVPAVGQPTPVPALSSPGAAGPTLPANPENGPGIGSGIYGLGPARLRVLPRLLRLQEDL